MRKLKNLSPLLLMLAGACAVGPTYQRPVPKAAANAPFVTRSAAFDPAASLPDDWWHLYRDPALDDLIRRAFAANTDLRVAVANLAKARAVLQESRIGRLPTEKRILS